jgi:hypothetical protein
MELDQDANSAGTYVQEHGALDEGFCGGHVFGFYDEERAVQGLAIWIKGWACHLHPNRKPRIMDVCVVARLLAVAHLFVVGSVGSENDKVHFAPPPLNTHSKLFQLSLLN